MINRTHSVAVGVLIFLFLLTSTIISEAASNWARVNGGSESDYFDSLQHTKDGGYVFAGSTRSFGAEWNDAWVVKLDSNGPKPPFNLFCLIGKFHCTPRFLISVNF